MKLSKKSEYGLRALLELTLAYGPATLQRHEIAIRQHIPVDFLEQILLAPKRAGLLASRRGMKGGYTLIKSTRGDHPGPGHPHFRRAARADFLREQNRLSKMFRLPLCHQGLLPLQDAMGEVRNAIADILDHYTLSQFAKTKPAQRAS